jgi:hypothetical protein
MCPGCALPSPRVTFMILIRMLESRGRRWRPPATPRRPAGRCHIGEGDRGVARSPRARTEGLPIPAPGAALSRSNCVPLSRSTAAFSKSWTSMAASLSRRPRAISLSRSRMSGPVPTRCSRTGKRHSMESRRPRTSDSSVRFPLPEVTRRTPASYSPRMADTRADHLLTDPGRLDTQAVGLPGHPPIRD